MSDPFIGEIRIFAGDFAPRGWAFCNGQLLSLAQNTALFAIIGTTYGGDGRTNFALPNLQGRAPMHPGRGPGLTERRLGERSGAEEALLTQDTTPSHNHPLKASLPLAEDDDPGPDQYLATARGAGVYAPPANLVSMSPQAISELKSRSRAETRIVISDSECD